MSDVSVTFDGEMQGLRNELNGMRGEIGGWSSTIKTIGVTAFAAWGAKSLIDGIVGAWKAGISFVTDFLKDSFAEATAGIEVDTKLDVILRNVGKSAGFASEELKALASDLQSITSFDDDSIKEAQTSLLRFGNIAGDVFLRANKASLDLATLLGTDAAGAADVLGRALANPDRAARMLSKSVGLSADQTRNLQAAIKEANTEAEAQAEILAVVESAVGGMATEVADATGGVTQLAHIWADVKEESGRALMPILTEMLPGMKFILTEIGAEIVEFVKSLSEMALGFGGATADAENMSESMVVIFAEIERAIEKVWARTIQWIEAIKMLGRVGGMTPAGAAVQWATGTRDLFKEDRTALNKADAAIADQETAREAGDRRLRQFRERKAQDDAERAERMLQLRTKDQGSGASLGLGAGAAVGQLGPAFAAGIEQAMKDQLKTAFDTFGASAFGGETAAALGELKQTAESLKRAREADTKVAGGKAGESETDGGFRAQFEDAQSMFKRIQLAAASQGPKGIEQLAEKQLGVQEKMEQHLFKMVTSAPALAAGGVPVLGP